MNLAERIVTGNGAGPISGAVYVTATQTAVGFSVGVATNLSGLGIYNPVIAGTGGTAVKVVLLDANLAPSAVPAAVSVAMIAKWNTMQGTGTGFTGVKSANAPIFQHGLAGTSTNSTAVVFGTGSTMIIPSFVKALYGLGTYSGVTPGPLQLQGEISLLPGEAAIIVGSTAATGFASLTWAEVPL